MLMRLALAVINLITIAGASVVDAAASTAVDLTVCPLSNIISFININFLMLIKSENSNSKPQKYSTGRL